MAKQTGIAANCFVEKGLEMLAQVHHGAHVHIGLELTHLAKDKISGQMIVTEKAIQPAYYSFYLFFCSFLLHGGVSVLIAESLASIGSWANIVDRNGFTCVGSEINANHLRPVAQWSKIFATATPLHRGTTTHVWHIEIRDEEQRLVCVSRCTIAIIAWKSKL